MPGEQVTITPNPAGIAELIRSPSGPVFRHLIVLATKVQELARAQVGVKTGNLRDTIVKRIVHGVGPAGYAVEVGSDMPYALFHHEGFPAFTSSTGMYFITDGSGTGPNSAPAGSLIRINKHPGWKGNKYLSEPLAVVMAGEH